MCVGCSISESGQSQFGGWLWYGPVCYFATIPHLRHHSLSSETVFLPKFAKSDRENFQVVGAHLHGYYLHYCAMVLYMGGEVVLWPCWIGRN
jgi:hypothetical protein